MEDSAAPVLPLARIKKIAKCDKDVKSISQNTTVLMAKATVSILNLNNRFVLNLSTVFLGIIYRTTCKRCL